MIYEMRIYTLNPGKITLFEKRFAEVSRPFFEKHGIRLLASWRIAKLPEAEEQVSSSGRFLPASGAQFDGEKIAYLVCFESVEARDRAWRAFVNDPAWGKALDAAEGKERCVKDEEFFLLEPMSFSPLG